MIDREPLEPQRVRTITGSFAFIEHRFLREGFWASLSHHELLLYLFLVLVADRKGMSWYSYDKICSLVRLTPDDYIAARNALIEKDLIAFDGFVFQVLCLPEKVLWPPCRPLKSQEEMERYDPATIDQLIGRSLGKNHQE